MNTPPRIAASGVPFDGQLSQLRQAMAQQGQRGQVYGEQQLPQQMALAERVGQQVEASASGAELKAADLLNRAKAGVQLSALQLDPSALAGTQAVQAMAQHLSASQPGVDPRALVAARIGLS